MRINGSHGQAGLVARLQGSGRVRHHAVSGTARRPRTRGILSRPSRVASAPLLSAATLLIWGLFVGLVLLMIAPPGRG